MARWRLLLLLLLVGCSDEASLAQRKADQASARRSANAALLSTQAPRLTRHAMAGGELLVMEIPVDAYGKTIEMRKCFIWRDAQYQSASMQCPADVSEDTPID